MKKTATNRLAIIFDFDDTLAPDSTSSFLEKQGVDTKKFWKEHRKLLDQGWDPIPGYMEMMLRFSRAQKKERRITKTKLERFAKRLKPHDGLPTFFSRLRRVVKRLSPATDLHFFVISSGIGDIVRNVSFSDVFTDIWASDFYYNRDGEIDGIKNVISFTDKTRYLFYIRKGLIGKKFKGDPFIVNKKIPEADEFVNFRNMIMVGDGYTDIPCFSLVENSGGTAIGVYDREAADRWGKAWGLLNEKRVKQMVAADFRKDRGLDDAIHLAVKSTLTIGSY